MSNNKSKKPFVKRKDYRPKRPDEPPKLTLLTHGVDTNYPVWKKTMRNEIAEKYGLLVSIVDEGAAPQPDVIEMDDFDLANDPLGIELHRLKTAVTEQSKIVAQIKRDKPKCHALLWKYLSSESQEAVLGHEDYDEELHRSDALQLALSIEATHQGGGQAGDAATRRTVAREQYRQLKQGPTEVISDYKSRFTFMKKAYDDTGNVELPENDVTNDFFNGLDNHRYAKFKTDIVNDRSKGVEGPQTLNTMYQRASTYVVEKSSWRPNGGAAFATRADTVHRGGQGRGQGGRGNGRGNGRGQGKGRGNANHTKSDSSKSAGDDQKADKPKSDKKKKAITCYACGEEGHMSFNCPNEGDDQEETGRQFATFGLFHMAGAEVVGDHHPTTSENHDSVSWDDDDDEEVPMLVSDSDSDEDEEIPDLVSDSNLDDVEIKNANCYVSTANGRSMTTMAPKMPWNEVLLDNQADISVIHPLLMQNVRKSKSYVSGLAGTTELPYVGYLDGFFECKGGTDLIASVLCMSDVEDLYDITYIQGESYTVHLPDGDLVFKRRNKLYVADMSEWATNAPAVYVTTTSENEAGYSALEVKRARKAKELIENSGFSSEHDALGLATDGNLTGVPVTSKDVKRAFEIYGKTPQGVRGRRTQHKVKSQSVNEDIKSPFGEKQEMYGDVAFFSQQPFLVCLSMPLGLITVSELANRKATTLGSALHTHISTIQNRGFNPTIVHLDPERGFTALESAVPGVEVDVSGAGDHMAKLDVNIRHIKEIYRSTYDSLPWKMPKWMVKDFVKYCVSRRNLRRTSRTAEAPRVKFTGRKPAYAQELSIGYGDYVESYDPKVVSNNAEQKRTVPCLHSIPLAMPMGPGGYCR